jgi:hypothetical protein
VLGEPGELLVEPVWCHREAPGIEPFARNTMIHQDGRTIHARSSGSRLPDMAADTPINGGFHPFHIPKNHRRQGND